jgi:hypothetical protein
VPIGSGWLRSSRLGSGRFGHDVFGTSSSGARFLRDGIGVTLAQDWLTASHRNRRARYEAREGIGQHHERRRELRWLARPLHRHLLADVGHRVPQATSMGSAASKSPAALRRWRECPSRREAGRGSGEVLDRNFGRRVGQQDRVWHVEVDARRIDDGAAPLHVRHRGLGQVEHRSGC